MQQQTKQSVIITDEKIVELFWQRDELAIRETDLKYKNFLLSIAYNIVCDIYDSEECLNDTYIGAWNAIPPAKPTLLKVLIAIKPRSANAPTVTVALFFKVNL